MQAKLHLLMGNPDGAACIPRFLKNCWKWQDPDGLQDPATAVPFHSRTGVPQPHPVSDWRHLPLTREQLVHALIGKTVVVQAQDNPDGLFLREYGTEPPSGSAPELRAP